MCGLANSLSFRSLWAKPDGGGVETTFLSLRSDATDYVFRKSTGKSCNTQEMSGINFLSYIYPRNTEEPRQELVVTCTYIKDRIGI